MHEFQVIHPGRKSVLYQIKLGDEPILAPIVGFVTEVIFFTPT